MGLMYKKGKVASFNPMMGVSIQMLRAATQAEDQKRDILELQNFVVDGGVLECSEGSVPYVIKVPTGTSENVGDQRQVHIQHKELENIDMTAFGICARKREQYDNQFPESFCQVRLSSVWELEKEDTIIGGEPGISTRSELICDEGGIITVLEDGQGLPIKRSGAAIAEAGYAGLLETCLVISQADTALIGPADVVAAIIAAGGTAAYAVSNLYDYMNQNVTPNYHRLIGVDGVPLAADSNATRASDRENAEGDSEARAEEDGKSKVEVPKDVQRKVKKLSPEAKKGYDKALKGLEEGDTKGLNDHPLTGGRSGQRAVDIKGTGKGRGAGRVIYERNSDGSIKVVDIILDHKY